MTIRGLHWDERNEEHIARHGVRWWEVEEAVFGYSYRYKHRGRLMVLGQTEGGRHLAVVLEDLGQGLWLPITARDMKVSEQRLFQKHARRRR